MIKKHRNKRDNRLAALALLTKIYQNPKTKEDISAGLPIIGEKLDRDLFVRAAQNAGLKASIQTSQMSAASTARPEIEGSFLVESQAQTETTLPRSSF